MTPPSCTISPAGSGTAEVTLSGRHDFDEGAFLEWYKCVAKPKPGWKFSHWEWDEVNRWTERGSGASGEETHHLESTSNPLDDESGVYYSDSGTGSRYYSSDITSPENLVAVFVKAEWVKGTGRPMFYRDRSAFPICAEDGIIIYDNGHWA